MKFRHYFILLTVLLSSFLVHGQEGQWLIEAERDTSSILSLRIMDTTSIYSLRDDLDFRYSTGPKSGETLWQRIKRWIYEKLIAPFLREGGGGVADILMLLLAIGGVFIMFYFFFKNKKTTSIERQDLTWGEVFSNPTEVEERQFNLWIQSAEQKSDYNEALKYLYLKCIRQMDKKNLLHYRPEYTNRQVINKLKNEDVKTVFKEVSRQFEYVWYGHFLLDETEYFRLKSLVNKSVLGL